MDQQFIYVILAFVITVVLVILTFLKGKRSVGSSESDGAVAENEEAVRVRPRPLNQAAPGGNEGPRNRALANRNARARMRVAQAQRLHQHSDSEDELTQLGDEIALPDGKIGKKKLAKLQMKAEKKAMREAEEKEREGKKERDEEKAERQRQIEKEREEEEARLEEEERKKREELERKEQEEYERLKVEFEVQEEGCDEDTDAEKTKNLLQEFLNYIKKNKVVVLEDLAALFDLKTQVVIDRITEFQKQGTLTGVIDDRGKFIYITRGELESVAKFIRQRGRVSLTDIAEASNTLINLKPEAEVEA